MCELKFRIEGLVCDYPKPLPGPLENCPHVPSCECLPGARGAEWWHFITIGPPSIDGNTFGGRREGRVFGPQEPEGLPCADYKV